MRAVAAFNRLTYAEAVDRFGLDKPDLRFGLELKEVTDIVKGSGFKVFASVAQKGGMVKALNAKGCIDFSRKEIDDLTEFAAIYKAKGLAWIKVREDGWQSPHRQVFLPMTKRPDWPSASTWPPGIWSFLWPTSPR